MSRDRLTSSCPPVWVAAAYLGSGPAGLRGITSDSPRMGQASRVLVFEDGHARAWLDFDRVPSAGELDAGYARIRNRRSEQSLPTSAPRPLPSCTVVVCTRERPEQLRRCLRALVEAVAPDETILVVDNAPRTELTRKVIAEFSEAPIPVQRLHAPLPGLSRARNAGLSAATGDIVVFLDDDTMPEPGWTIPLREAFARDATVAVATGLVPPAELNTVGQQLFQARLHWSEQLEPRLYSYATREGVGPLFPFAAGLFGTGANMAVRRSALDHVGGFDEHLGAGTTSRGGEDLEMFVRTLRKGWSLAYVPDSVVWHVHARELDQIRRNVFGYGSGLTAYLTAVLAQPRRREMVARVAPGLRYAVAERRRLHAPSRASTDLLRQEILGFAWGPFAYAGSRMRASYRSMTATRLAGTD